MTRCPIAQLGKFLVLFSVTGGKQNVVFSTVIFYKYTGFGINFLFPIELC